MKPYSLTTRLILWFALMSFLVLATVGILLYRGLETQLTLRDDAALVTRVDQIRTLLRNADVLDLVHGKPHLFENMLGNHEALLVLRYIGQIPLIEVNPGHTPIPDLIPVAADGELSLSAVHHTTGKDGMPFIAVAASVRTAGSSHDLEILAGRVMVERTGLLDAYRNRILFLSGAAAVLMAIFAFLFARRGLSPLHSLAAQTNAIGIKNLSLRIDLHDAPTELLPLIDTFNAMLGRLATGFTQLNQVSADMAHDLRTPIGNLLGQTEVALSQTRDIAYYEKLLASNFEELQRLAKMTENMLFLARAENASIAIDKQLLDVNDELQRLADYFEGLAFDRAQRIILRLVTGSGSTISADPTLLRRAMANLIANAVRYADPDTDILLIAALGNDVANTMTLTVENTGPTIKQADLARIFDRFYRADTARSCAAHACGLGLSIVRSIMVLHEGSCTVSSHAGVTRFTLVFPKK